MVRSAKSEGKGGGGVVGFMGFMEFVEFMRFIGFVELGEFAGFMVWGPGCEVRGAWSLSQHSLIVSLVLQVANEAIQELLHRGSLIVHARKCFFIQVLLIACDIQM